MVVKRRFDPLPSAVMPFGMRIEPRAQHRLDLHLVQAMGHVRVTVALVQVPRDLMHSQVAPRLYADERVGQPLQQPVRALHPHVRPLQRRPVLRVDARHRVDHLGIVVVVQISERRVKHALRLAISPHTRRLVAVHHLIDDRVGVGRLIAVLLVDSDHPLDLRRVGAIVVVRFPHQPKLSTRSLAIAERRAIAQARDVDLLLQRVKDGNVARRPAGQVRRLPGELGEQTLQRDHDVSFRIYNARGKQLSDALRRRIRCKVSRVPVAHRRYGERSVGGVVVVGVVMGIDHLKRRASILGVLVRATVKVEGGFTRRVSSTRIFVYSDATL